MGSPFWSVTVTVAWTCVPTGTVELARVITAALATGVGGGMTVHNS
jgi:hypothetical protein